MGFVIRLGRFKKQLRAETKSLKYGKTSKFGSEIEENGPPEGLDLPFGRPWSPYGTRMPLGSVF